MTYPLASQERDELEVEYCRIGAQLSPDELRVLMESARRIIDARAAKRQNVLGHRFGRLVAVEFAALANDQHRRWRCMCDCGQIKTVLGSNLKCGYTQSCGCLHKERNAAAHLTHGHTVGNKNTPSYSTWRSMHSRCTNEKEYAYRYYGGRGITICDRWLGPTGFQNFLADMGERPRGHTIDRIDVNGNYEPSNCRWATPKQQARNTRANKLEPHEPDQIRWLVSLGHTQRAVAEFFCVHPRLVSLIVKEEIWS